MKTRTIRKTLLAFLLLTGGALSQEGQKTETGKTESQRPNILFIFADDWGWGDLSCHGHPFIRTPNIDRLAKEGRDFQNFTVASGVCSPSRTAVMTGLFPARLGVVGHFAWVEDNEKRNMPDWVDPAVETTPRILKDSGYMTAHFGKWHLANNMIPDSPRPELYGYDEVGAFNCSGVQMPVHNDAKRAIAFIEKSNEAKKPFFINLWVHEPHTPFHTEEKYRERFPDLPESQNVYASVLSHADDRIGEVLDTLDRLGIADNTLVIFSSDNGPAGKDEIGGPLTVINDTATGEGFGLGAAVGSTAGRKGRKTYLYQGGIGIPFLVRWPGHVEAGSKDDVSWISAVDLLPTLCEIAGAEVPADLKLDGMSQVSVLKGEEKPLREKTLYWESQAASPKRIDSFAILEGKWKLLATSDNKGIELYEITKDPLEKTDVKADHPEVVEELVAKLEKWKTTLPKKPNPKLFSSLRKKKAE